MTEVTAQMERVLPFAAALDAVIQHASALGVPRATERVALHAAHGRVLAETLVAPRDQPPFDRSTRDGFAVRAEDAAEGKKLLVRGTLRAGSVWQHARLLPGEAIEIMTGAPLPPGADAVLMVEHARTVEAGRIMILHGRTIAAGDNIVARGAEVTQHTPVLAAHRLLSAAEIALAASCGRSYLEVFDRPAVAIIATGDELVELPASGEPAPPLGAAEIFNSNSHALAALVAQAGGAPLRLPIARDTLDDLRARLSAGARAELLLFSGGVSMGKFDLVEHALEEAGAEFIFTGARIQPGKPVLFGRLPRETIDTNGETHWQYFFGLPGNPVSTEVCFHLFAAVMLRALCGRFDLSPLFLEATAGERFDGKPGLLRFLPATIEGTISGATVRAVKWQGSGDVRANAAANGYCAVDENGLETGSRSRVLLRMPAY